jgi:hypothetical protein
MSRTFLAAMLLGLATATGAFAQATLPPQLPLCMVGDSITWAGDGDYWRKYLLEEIPTLAFLGTHSSVLGYSHAGEGLDDTSRVLSRMADIPASPYYHLLIGTNDALIHNNEESPDAVAENTADRILQIVRGLLAKPGTRKVFLGSLVPCNTRDPVRDRHNAKVNAILRPQVGKLFPDGRVVWVEYENPIRAMRNWEQIIQLHPTRIGYRLLAIILAQTLRQELALNPDMQPPVPVAGAGVKVTNLWGDGKSTGPIVPGWYTMSFDVTSAKPGASLMLASEVDDPGKIAKLLNPMAKRNLVIPVESIGKRMTWNLMTGYEGVDYVRGPLVLTTTNCRIGRVLFEKQRPSARASKYGTGTYLDTASPISLGELVEQ